MSIYLNEIDIASATWSIQCLFKSLMGRLSGEFEFIFYIFSWGSLKSDKKSFQVSVAVGTVATFIRRHHCWLLHNNVAENEWMNEWMTEWASVWVSEWVGWLQWSWIGGSECRATTTMFSIRYKPCTFPAPGSTFSSRHLASASASASPPASTTIPQALPCTLSVLGFLFSVYYPWYHPWSHSGSHVLHFQQRHFKTANQSNSCRRVSIFNFKDNGLCV